MRYLDPKNDLTFKKIFGQHPHLLKSFLNALLPLESPIVSLEYLPAELVPEIPVLKHSIVDVRCKDQRGRQFIVEMQMLWTDSFKSRVLFNASKAYVGQLGKAVQYKSIHPVIALSLVNEDFEHDTEEYYHHYKIVHSQLPDKVLEGLEFVFVELPKFKAKSITEKKLSVLWLRFLAEIENNTTEISSDLREVPEIEEALQLLAESGYSVSELAAYDKYWDSIAAEKTIMIDAFEQGYDEGIEIGREEGREEGRKEERTKVYQEKLSTAKVLKVMGLSTNQIAQATGLSESEIENLN